MFFGALALSTVTYVGCKDYDDDIDNLQTQIDANKASIESLQKFVDNGKWVTNVESIAGGFKITFNDDKSYEIVNGAKGDKGDKGDTGATGAPGVAGTPGAAGADGAPGSKVTIDPETGEWLIDNEPTGWFAKVEDGHSPYIEDGYWYFWDKTANEFVKGDKAQGEPGASVPGTDGKSPYINDDGNWVYFNVAGEEVVGPKAAGTNGKDGNDGKDAQAPFIGEDGYWYYWDATAEDGKGKLVQGDYAQTSVYIVKGTDRPNWVLHVGTPNADGSYTDQTVILPSADKISSMKVVSISKEGSISVPVQAVDVEMYYGRAGKDFEFNGVKYAAGDLLTSKGSLIYALINPVDLELSAYTIGLTDSKGNTNYKISKVAQNMSEKPLTRAKEDETPNKGIFDLSIAVADGVTYSALEGSNDYAYALTTKDAFGKEIISEYAVKVKADSEVKACTDFAVDAFYRTEYDLDELVEDKMNNAVDFYYAIDTDEGKTAAALMDVEFDAKARTISAEKEGDLPLTVHYLKTNGEEATVTMTIKFKNIVVDFAVADMEWTITPDAKKQWVAYELSAKTMQEFLRQGRYNIALAEKDGIVYTNSPIRVNGEEFKYDNTVENSITFELVAADIKGEKINIKNEADYKKGVKFYVVAKFDPELVAATSHDVTLNIIEPAAKPANKVLYTAKFKVVVKQDNDKIFKFEPLDAYFDKDTKTKATAYGDLNKAGDKILYNLNKLFSVRTTEEADYITFEETIPTFDGVKAAAWLSEGSKSDAISVDPMKDEKPTDTPDGIADDDNAGVYSTREFVSTYHPFNNKRLATYSYKYNLTVKSPIKEGKHPDIDKLDKSKNVLSMTSRNFTFTMSEIKWQDRYSEAISWSGEGKDTRINKVYVSLSEVAAEYMEFTVGDGEAQQGTKPVEISDATKNIKVTLKTDVTEITNSVAGTDNYVIITVVDKWGATTQSKVLVPINK